MNVIAAAVMTLGMAFLPHMQASAQIKADTTAPGNQQAQVLKTANQVIQVDIQTPSAAGVSRNVYSQFDVPAQGAILNNSRNNVQTQSGDFERGELL